MDLVLGIGSGITRFLQKMIDSNKEFAKSIDAVMLSYAIASESPKDFRMIWKRRNIKETYQLPSHIKIFLDNGSFSFATKGYEGSLKAYENFVERVNPEWAPMPRDYIPMKNMTVDEKFGCMIKTMENNQKYAGDRYAMILHGGPAFEEYIKRCQASKEIMSSKYIAVGMYRAERAVFDKLYHYVHTAREAFKDHQLHIFGVGGTRIMIHIAALLGADSIDTVAWYTKSIVWGHIISPNPLRATFSMAEHLTGRRKYSLPKPGDFEDLEKCPCPSCSTVGYEVLKENSDAGDVARITHNVYHLLDERNQVEYHLKNGSYDDWQKERNPELWQRFKQLENAGQSNQLTLF